MTEIERLDKIKYKHSEFCVGDELGVGEDDVDFLIEQAKKYEELQKAWWWLERRTDSDGKIPYTIIRYFLHDIRKYFKSYEEE